MRRIIFYHLNDVYHIHDRHLLARFSYAITAHKTRDNALTIFSGDAFGPSLESSILKGRHIVPVLNHLQVDLACYGNHDFDFGEDHLRELCKGCNFPFTLSNATNNGKLLASAKEYLIRTSNGLKIGFFGLAGTDWPSNCQNLPPDLSIAPVTESAKRLAQHLRNRQSVDLIIALTHMRLPEDLQVAALDDDVDLVLGGHDHDFTVHGNKVTAIEDMFSGDIRIIKSGTDFRDFSRVVLDVEERGQRSKIVNVQVQRIRDSPTNPEDEEMLDILASVHKQIDSISSQPIAFSKVSLEGRSSRIRTEETNLGNLLADTVRAYYKTDIALVNSGSIRCDRCIPEGVLTVRDIIDIVPFDNPWVVKRLSGKIILAALENSVSDSRTDGRFFQVSGLQFTYNLHLPEGQRILQVEVVAGDNDKQPLDRNRSYAVTMTSFIAAGFDGYECLVDAESLVDAEAAMTDTSLLLRIFRHDEGDDSKVLRARNAVIIDEKEGLPLISPNASGRIVCTQTTHISIL